MVRSNQMLFGYLADKNAKYYPDKIFLVDENRRCTFREFNSRTNAMARGFLNAGIKPGDRVAVLNHNSVELFEVYFGAMKAAAIPVPINVRLAPPEVAEILQDAAPSLLLAHKNYLPKIPPKGPGQTWSQVYAIGGSETLPDYETLIGNYSTSRVEPVADDDDPAILIYTSGTTGKPKGVMLTHRNLLADVWSSCVTRRLAPDDVALVTAPLYQAGAFGSMIANVFRGNTIVILDGFDPPKVLATIEREKVSTALFVPAMIIKLLEFEDRGRYDLSSMRTVVYGAAPMPVGALKQAMERFRWDFIGACGATETGPGYIAFLDRENHYLDGSAQMEKRLQSIGKEGINAEVRIFDDEDRELPPGEVGEIVLRGQNIMKGYWGKPRETAEALRSGWYHTGDLGYMDADGYIYIVDRKKDLIISGGFNVYPKEIENVLDTHPAVLESAVVGIPHPRWGETPLAFVVLKKGAPAPELGALMGFLRERLADYKLPRGGIQFTQELPRNASGKVLKRELRARVSPKS
jgi:acyl-CoA synthetase (AMP-forming)/AMP-acid ligase II